jgi:hypothetical protein
MGAEGGSWAWCTNGNGAEQAPRNTEQGELGFRDGNGDGRGDLATGLRAWAGLSEKKRGSEPGEAKVTWADCHFGPERKEGESLKEIFFPLFRNRVRTQIQIMFVFKPKLK